MNENGQTAVATLVSILLLLAPMPTVLAQADQYVDLSPRERSSIEELQRSDGADSHVLAKPWWENFDIYGFGAAGYYDTGPNGTRPHGNFEIKEASLFIEADVWENASFFIEFQTNRLGKDDQLFTRTGEVYVHLRQLQLGDLQPIGLKLGRIDIPFGEEYLWQDAIDNPLITNSAAYPYGWDEGLLLYGDAKSISWVFAIMDGTDARSQEDNSDKAVAVRVSSTPIAPLDLSLSLMTSGDNSKSAIEFGGSHFRPIGAAHVSSLGASPNSQVGGELFELNAKYQLLPEDAARSAYVSIAIGTANQDDADPVFDRTFHWYSIEPFVRFNNEWYAVLRYSQIETDDANQGFHFDGKIFAGGNGAFGYDTIRFRRVGLGVGWTPNPKVRAKLEIGEDSFDLIQASPLLNNGGRGFIGVELAVGF